MKKVLLIRLDKIGDLISTMCVDQAQFLQGAEVHWAIATGLAFIPEMAEPRRTYLELSKNDWKESLKKFRLYLKEFKPDVAVSFQAPWWVSYALWLERVPVRAGVQSQWHSFLFLNRGLRQRRSLAVQHEAEYNLDLLKLAMGVKSSEKAPVLKLAAPEDTGLLEQHQLKAREYLVVHPGMAGSALNWPTEKYIEFIEKALLLNKIVLTGTANDEAWLTKIKTTFKDQPQVLNLQSQLTTPQLFTILKNARAVIVPSTGVAHMAASLGTPVLAIYSPVRVQHPRRWAARGKDVQIFLPEVPCPATFRCLGDKCIYYNCMNRISTEQVLMALPPLR